MGFLVCSFVDFSSVQCLVVVEVLVHVLAASTLLGRPFWFYMICVDRICGLVVRDPGYITEMYCDYCEVRTEFIYVM
jgi:hypothetical protein